MYSRTRDTLAFLWTILTLVSVNVSVALATEAYLSRQERLEQTERAEYYAELVARCLNGKRLLVGRTIVRCDVTEVWDWRGTHATND